MTYAVSAGAPRSRKGRKAAPAIQAPAQPVLSLIDQLSKRMTVTSHVETYGRQLPYAGKPFRGQIQRTSHVRKPPPQFPQAALHPDKPDRLPRYEYEESL